MRQRGITSEVAEGTNVSSATSGTPETVSRAAADAALVRALAADGFRGPRWDEFTSRLMEYGWRVLSSWIFSGAIFYECAKRGRALKVTPDVLEVLRSDLDLRSELAIDTVLAALPKFRDRLANGDWQPERSQLTTYFTGALILDFPNIYRSWDARRSRSFSEEPLDLSGTFDVESRQRGPAAIAEDRDEVRRIVGTLPTDVRKMLAMRAAGYTNQAIAGQLGITEKAVEGRLNRLRRRYADAQIGRSGR
ncbi:sigma factor-like helix-turn-helix DNA-binding protein [Streptomyces sp. NPDC002845]